MLEIKNLFVQIQDKFLLEDINLSISKDCVIMGPNGSGKTTLFKTITGIQAIKSGSISVRGDNISNLSIEDRVKQYNIMMAFQRPVSIPGLSLLQMITHTVSNLKPEFPITEIYTLTLQIAQSLKISELLTKSVNTDISGGERKKAELLQLAVAQPQIALYDEIEAGVDIDGIKDVISVIKSWDHQKIIISHTAELALALDIKHCIVLNKNKIVAQGDESLILAISQYGFKYVGISN